MIYAQLGIHNIEKVLFQPSPLNTDHNVRIIFVSPSIWKDIYDSDPLNQLYYKYVVSGGDWSRLRWDHQWPIPSSKYPSKTVLESAIMESVDACVRYKFGEESDQSKYFGFEEKCSILNTDIWIKATPPPDWDSSNLGLYVSFLVLTPECPLKWIKDMSTNWFMLNGWTEFVKLSLNYFPLDNALYEAYALVEKLSTNSDYELTEIWDFAQMLKNNK